MPDTVPLTYFALEKGIVGGPFGSSLGSKDYVSDGVPVIRGQNLASDGYFDASEFVFVSERKADVELHRNIALPGDVVFTQRGTLGQVGLVPAQPYPRYVISQSQMRMRVDSSVADPRFIYYCFRDARMLEQIKARAITTGVPHINLGILSALEVPNHSIQVQRAISDLVGALDARIAVNERIVATACELAEAYFIAMQAKATHLVRLDSLVDLRYGKALKEEDRTPGQVPVFGGNGRSGWHDVSLVEGPGVIVGRKGANAGSVSWSEARFWPIDTAFYVKPSRSDTPMEFVYFLLAKANFRKLVGDSAIPGLNRDMALACEMKIPDQHEIGTFAGRVRPLLKLAAGRERENRTLAELRDTLLPKLMSGELRIRDADRQVGEVT